jgi:hypothetical protein
MCDGQPERPLKTKACLKGTLTVSCDGETLKERPSFVILEGRDLSRCKFGQEFGLFVVFEVLISRWSV